MRGKAVSQTEPGCWAEQRSAGSLLCQGNCIVHTQGHAWCKICVIVGGLSFFWLNLDKLYWGRSFYIYLVVFWMHQLQSASQYKRDEYWFEWSPFAPVCFGLRCCAPVWQLLVMNVVYRTFNTPEKNMEYDQPYPFITRLTLTVRLTPVLYLTLRSSSKLTLKV